MDVCLYEQMEEAIGIYMNTRILESMAEGVGLVDDEGVFLYTNPAWEWMLGYGRGELTGTRLSQELLGHLRDQGRWAGELQYVRKDRAPSRPTPR
ncbi:PAS domain S-box protein [Cystobacter fuscus]